ncbi:hypothetical protein CN899_28945, partial [Bacillus thuringiensis]
MTKKRPFKKNLKTTLSTVTAAGILLTGVSPSFAEELRKEIVQEQAPLEEKQAKPVDELVDAEADQVGATNATHIRDTENAPSGSGVRAETRASNNRLSGVYANANTQGQVTLEAYTTTYYPLFAESVNFYINGSFIGSRTLPSNQRVSLTASRYVNKGDTYQMVLIGRFNAILDTRSGTFSNSNRAPSAPTIHSVKDIDTKISGTAEGGVTIRVYVNNQVIATGTANSSGSYSINIPKQTAGTKISVTASNSVGSSSAAVTTVQKDVSTDAKEKVEGLFTDGKFDTIKETTDQKAID